MANLEFLTGIDLNRNQLVAAVVENVGSDPVTLADGQIWYRTDLDFLRLRANGASRTVLDSSYTLDLIPLAAADVDLNNHKITNLTTPTDASDAANKGYVDTVFTGMDWKESVRVATTAAGTLASDFENGDTVDGVVLATGDRILIKNQAASETNGIYVVAATGAPTRAADANTSAEVTAGMTVAVEEGTTNADSIWMLTTNDDITLGTTGLTFTQIPAAGGIVGGDGLTLTGNTLDVNVDDSSIEINADTLRVKASGITNAMLAGSIDLTTKVTGVLPIANGGTNANSAANAKTQLGFMTRHAADITGDNSEVNFVVTHNLNTKDVVVQVYDPDASDATVYVDVIRNTVNQVTVRFAVAPAGAKVYRVVVIG